MDDAGEGSEAAGISLGPALDLPPHGFVETEPTVVFSDPGYDAAREATRLRREDYDRYLGATFSSTCYDWFPSKVIKRWGERHCNAILHMIATINVSDITEYERLFTAVFASHPDELKEIANSRVEDVFAPEELKQPGKTYLKMVLWQLRDPTMSFEQHRQRDREIEEEWKASGQTALPRNIRFNDFWRDAYAKAVAEVDNDPTAREAIGKYLHNYVRETAPKTFASYIRSTYAKDVNDTTNMPLAPQAAASNVEVTDGGDGAIGNYRLHQRSMSHPVLLQSYTDDYYNPVNSPGNPTHSVSSRRRLVSAPITETAGTNVDAPQESSPSAIVAAIAPELPVAVSTQPSATASNEPINVTVTTTFRTEQPVTFESAPNFQIHGAGTQVVLTPAFDPDQATAQPHMSPQAQLYPAQGAPQELREHGSLRDPILHTSYSPSHVPYSNSGFPHQYTVHPPVSAVSGMTAPPHGAAHIPMGTYVVPGQAYYSLEQQAHQLPQMPQGSYITNIAPHSLPPHAANVGYHYNPALISPHGPAQPFPPFPQPFISPYAQAVGYNAPMNSSSGIRQRSNSSSRGRGRGRRHANHDPPAIFNHVTNQFEVVDSFGQSYQGPPTMAYQTRHNNNGFNQDRGNRERNYQYRDTNNNWRSNCAPRRSSASYVHTHAHPAHQYAQRASNISASLNMPAPPSATPGSSSKGKAKASGSGSPSATPDTRYASKINECRRPRSLSLNSSPIFQALDESPALYNSPDDTDEENLLTENRGKRKFYLKRANKTSSHRGSEKQQLSGDVAKSDAASGTSIITNPSETTVDVDGTLRRTIEGKLVYEFQPDSPIGLARNSKISNTDGADTLTGQDTYVCNVSLETVKPAIQTSDGPQDSQKHSECAGEASPIAELATDTKGSAAVDPSIDQRAEMSSKAATAFEEMRPNELTSQIAAAGEHHLMQTTDVSKQEADTAIQKDDEILETEQAECCAEGKNLTKESKVMEAGDGMHSILGSDTARNMPESVTAPEAKEAKALPLQNGNSTSAKVQLDTQEQIFTLKSVGTPLSQEKLPRAGDEVKQTVLEVAGNPRRVLSATGEIDVFWDAHETNSNPTADSSQENTPSKPPTRPQKTTDVKAEAQEDSKTRGEIDDLIVDPDAESNDALKESGVPHALISESNASYATQPKDVPCAGDEALVMPEHGSTLGEDVKGTSQSLECTSPSLAVESGNGNADTDSVEPTYPAKDTGSKSDDNWVHPMARARRQAKQEKLKAKKDREKEKKARQHGKKGTHEGNSPSDDTTSAGKSEQAQMNGRRLIRDADPNPGPLNSAEVEEEKPVDGQKARSCAVEPANTLAEVGCALSATDDAQTNIEPMVQDIAATEPESKQPTSKKSKKKRKKAISSSGDPQALGSPASDHAELSTDPKKPAETPPIANASKVKENVAPALPNIRPPTGKLIADRILNAGAQLGENKAASNRPS